jgi:hypothetical protein
MAVIRFLPPPSKPKEFTDIKAICYVEKYTFFRIFLSDNEYLYKSYCSLSNAYSSILSITSTLLFFPSGKENRTYHLLPSILSSVLTSTFPTTTLI